MARDDEQDERDRRDPPKRPGRNKWMDDEDDRPRKSGFPTWAMILVAVLGTMLVCGCVAGAVVVMWTSAPAGGGGATPPPPQQAK
jgi:hypothetical protein